VDTPSLLSPVDPGELITAIATQERRVLELREELMRAELELNKLKKHWANHEAHKKRVPVRSAAEPLRLPLASHVDAPEDPATRRSADLDRRKALLLGQQGQQSTPQHQNRRRVFHGGHTRTLSLLSPIKPSTEGFDVHEDVTRVDNWKPPARETDLLAGTGYTTIYPTPLSKRASWAPRSVHQQTSGVKQIAEDLKSGLWTFMEDLRQATVGDEPITGQGTYLRGIDGNMRSTTTTRGGGGERDENQETIRASTSSARPRASSLFEDSEETPTPASRFVDKCEKEKENSARPSASGQPSSSSSTSASQNKVSAVAKNQKRFSWTPLTMESIDDSDWSNWDSPTVKSPRWSGSTISGDVIAEGGCDENSAPTADGSNKLPSP
jgi:hypothetical protein